LIQPAWTSTSIRVVLQQMSCFSRRGLRVAWGVRPLGGGGSPGIGARSFCAEAGSGSHPSAASSSDGPAPAAEPHFSGPPRGGFWAERRADRDARPDRGHLDPRAHRYQTGWQARSSMDFGDLPDQRKQIKEVRWLSRNRRWEEAVHLMSLEAEPNPIFRTAVLDACVKSLQQRAAWQVFNEMPMKTTAAYNSLIALQGRLKQIEVAEDLLHKMRDNGLQPDFVTYTTLITAYGTVHDVEKALATLERMKAEGMQVDRVAYGAAMSACAKAGDKDSTWKLLGAMDEARLETDITHLTSLIVSCARTKDEARAREAFPEFSKRGIALDSIVYTSFIHCLPVTGKQAVDAAVEVLKEMKGRAILPDTHTYNAAIRVAVTCEAEDRSRELLAEMESAGFQPNRETEFILSGGNNFYRGQDQQALSSPGDVAAASQPALPPGWASAADPSTGRSYYWREADPAGSTTWERPQV